MWRDSARLVEGARTRPEMRVKGSVAIDRLAESTGATEYVSRYALECWRPRLDNGVCGRAYRLLVEGRTHPWTVAKRDGKGLAVRYLDDAPLNGLPKRAWCCHAAMGALYCTHKGPDTISLHAPTVGTLPAHQRVSE